MVRVRTSQKCFVGGRLREVGSEFECDEDPAFYMTVVEEEPEPEPEPEPDPAPKTKAKKKAAKKD
jgi:hypothetical protein